jgi:polar amino acid transport system substrate-binding protein
MNHTISGKRRLVMAAGACCMLAAAPLAGATRARATLRVKTAHLPPLSIENDADRPGALYEVVAELCKRTGHTLDTQFVPWKRAIHLASATRATAVFPLTRVPGRERHFRWLVPLYDEHYVFLTPRGRAFDVRNPENMKDMRISLIRGSSLKDTLLQMGYKNIVEARSVDEVHRFLVVGMADAAFGERNIVRNSLRSRAAQDDFDISEPVRRASAWLAGSLDFTQHDAARFERAMKAMKADGTYQAILNRYELG